MTAEHAVDALAATQPATTAAVLAAARRALAVLGDAAALDAELLLAAATGRTRASLLAFPERGVPAVAVRALEALIARRAGGEPLAYLLGVREFFSLDLEVNASVLVPRPETELLVEAALARCARLVQPAVLDVGTGSGAIALAVKSERRDAQVTGVDTSAAALAVARRNAVRLGLAIRWLESTWFSAVAGEAFDVIISNPPYVHSADVVGALVHEPRQALDGGPDGLDAYRELLRDAPAHLRAGGALLLEHGADQRDALAALAAATGWRVVRALDDLAGRARVLELERGIA
ncbi:MAG TPA: peptide chain release factor N(5)-glutamine methyltransferase [Gammaproteobacteria bacterium]|nr:peptide chain release factor N(5)-glutamine methyltransferase [Gammaproteobacteria bacterium]